MASQVEQFSALGVEVRFKPSSSLEDTNSPVDGEEYRVTNEQALYLLSQVPSILDRDRKYIETISQHSSGGGDRPEPYTYVPPIPNTISSVLRCLEYFQKGNITTAKLGIDVGHILGHHRAWKSDQESQVGGLYLAYSEALTVLRNRAEQYSLYRIENTSSSADDYPCENRTPAALSTQSFFRGFREFGGFK